MWDYLVDPNPNIILSFIYLFAKAWWSIMSLDSLDEKDFRQEERRKNLRPKPQ